AALGDSATTPPPPPEDAGVAPTPDDLDAVLEPIRAASGLPALAATVYDGTLMLATGAVGTRRVEDATAVTDGDRWHLGSCTKAMTATLLATLVEEGVLDWDTTAVEAFPSFASSIDPGFRDVTLAELLRHRGGMDPEHSWLLDAYWTDARAVEVIRYEVAERLLSAAPVVPVGTFAYANSGYVVVGAAMESATGRSWESLLRERIFEPLGMTSCGFGAPGVAAPGPPDEPRGHYGTPLVSIEPTLEADNHPLLGPAGTAHCALSDWARFVAIHVAGARGEDTSVLPARAFARLHDPAGGDYALGWGVTTRDWADGLVLQHAGSNTLWYVVAWVAPVRNRFMLLATNTSLTASGDDAGGAIDEAAGELVGLHFP
ncbi:MAG: beta-lactamase family protein, partial [Deltaproteobacteria bacterium]|nr:beta-lactamase family protein [Deltaproteobacteria bacterium]